MNNMLILYSVVELIFGSKSSQIRTLRTIRVLRPLKSVNSIPGLKRHVATLWNALPNFFNVAVFLIFIFMLFSILGLHQYGAGFYNRCRYSPEPEEPGVRWDLVKEETRPCTKNGLGRHKCLPEHFCGNPYDFDLPLSIDDVRNNA
jgi:hypothetical protein